MASVVKTWRNKNMRAHILMFDLHLYRFDKIILINEYEWVVKVDSSITISISQLSHLSCARLSISSREELGMSVLLHAWHRSPLGRPRMPCSPCMVRPTFHYNNKWDRKKHKTQLTKSWTFTGCFQMSKRRHYNLLGSGKGFL